MSVSPNIIRLAPGTPAARAILTRALWQLASRDFESGFDGVSSEVNGVETQDQAQAIDSKIASLLSIRQPIDTLEDEGVFEADDIPAKDVARGIGSDRSGHCRS